MTTPEHYAFLDKLFPEKWEHRPETSSRYERYIFSNYLIELRPEYVELTTYLNDRKECKVFKNIKNAKAAARKHQLETLAKGADLSVILVWRDIESAPKDGTEILLLCMDHEIKVTSDYWHSYRNGDGHWENAEVLEDFIPTHWMPLEALPTPPETVK